ncbi:Phosphate import ATP-binding protein PstB 2 [Varanus komodoensis]|nr:Phosphate import ATP-binding protein PstB 2 [Varanus komodoensis]
MSLSINPRLAQPHVIQRDRILMALGSNPQIIVFKGKGLKHYCLKLTPQANNTEFFKYVGSRKASGEAIVPLADNGTKGVLKEDQETVEKLNLFICFHFIIKGMPAHNKQKIFVMLLTLVTYTFMIVMNAGAGSGAFRGDVYFIPLLGISPATMRRDSHQQPGPSSFGTSSFCGNMAGWVIHYQDSAEAQNNIGEPLSSLFSERYSDLCLPSVTIMMEVHVDHRIPNGGFAVSTKVEPRNELGWVYMRPDVLPLSFYLVWMLNNALNIGWLFLWDSLHFVPALLVLALLTLTSYAALFISHRALYPHTAWLNKHSKADLWLIRILVL